MAAEGWAADATLQWKTKQALLPYELRVQKTQITLFHSRVFACISLKWKNCITVSFGMPDRIASDRINQAAEIRANRWTHHVKITQFQEIDKELMGWLRIAHAYASGELR